MAQYLRITIRNTCFCWPAGRSDTALCMKNCINSPVLRRAAYALRSLEHNENDALLRTCGGRTPCIRL